MFLRLALLLLLTSNAFATELETVTPEDFKKELPSKERELIIDLLVNQFNGKSVTQAELDKLWYNEEAKETLHLARFQIINQKIYASGANETHPYFVGYVQYFQKLVSKYKINDIDFIIHSTDQLQEQKQYHPSLELLKNTPTFLMFKDTKDPYENTRLLIPEAFILSPSWERLLSDIETANKRYSWSNKKDNFFWRGATRDDAGLKYNLKNFNKLPRLTLVIISKLYPDIIDAKFTELVDGIVDKDLYNILTLLSPKEPTRISEVDHLKYKYLISIDGHSCSGVRVPWIMYSNSVLIKQESSKIEWFYPALQPYVNYVPINERLTDIFEQYQWLKTHDQEIQQISQNAHNFVQNNLMPEHIEKQMVITLNEYAKIQQDQKIIVKIPTAEETRSVKGISFAVIKRAKKELSNWIKNLW